MTQEETFLQEFRRTGAILNGHFLLSSGLHSDTYIQCARVMEDPAAGERLCQGLAERWPEKPTVVVGPAFGGILVAYELARAFGVRAIFYERVEGVFKLRRGFSLDANDRVLLAEDVITTGGSVSEVIEEVRKTDASIMGVTSLIHRGDKTTFTEELRPLLRLTPEAWPAESCPLCKEGSTPVKPGSRPGADTCKA